MKVCFIAHASKLEGADRSLLETVLILRQKGIEPHVIVPRNGKLVQVLDAEAVPYTVWPYFWWVGRSADAPHKKLARYGALVFTYFSAALFAARHRTKQADLVYSNTIASPFGLLVSKWSGKAHVCHIREFVDTDHKMMFLLGKRWTVRMLERNSAQLLANSKAVAQAFQPYLTRLTPAVAYQAVTLERPPARADAKDLSGPLRLVLVGRLHAGKGQETAIHAMRMLADQGVHVHLNIVGGGKAEYVEVLSSLIQRLALSEHISLVGPVDDPGAHYSECEVALMCSKNEAFGRVTIEAMKHGRPVIGARSGGTQELIANGETGWLFEPDDPADLAQAITDAFRVRSDLPHMGRHAQEWANSTFSTDKYAQQLTRVLETALQAHDHTGNSRP